MAGVKKLLRAMAGVLLGERTLGLVLRLIDLRLERLSPREGLRLLFRLDNALYDRQGGLAVDLGGGMHVKRRHVGYHEFFAQRIGPEDRVLDVGCGPGGVAREVAEAAGARVVGIDADPAMIARAREQAAHPRVEYLVGDALTDLPPGPFDVVILSNVLEHLEDRAGFLRGLLASARPDRLLVRVPVAERDWRVPVKRELGVEWRLDEGHHTEYTLESFAEEMAAAGLETIYLEVRWGEIRAELHPAREEPAGRQV